LSGDEAVIADINFFKQDKQPKRRGGIKPTLLFEAR
jgi:hypothetical protein